MKGLLVVYIILQLQVGHFYANQKMKFGKCGWQTAISKSHKTYKNTFHVQKDSPPTSSPDPEEVEEVIADAYIDDYMDKAEKYV